MLGPLTMHPPFGSIHDLTQRVRLRKRAQSGDHVLVSLLESQVCGEDVTFYLERSRRGGSECGDDAKQSSSLTVPETRRCPLSLRGLCHTVDA